MKKEEFEYKKVISLKKIKNEILVLKKFKFKIALASLKT